MGCTMTKLPASAQYHDSPTKEKLAYKFGFCKSRNPLYGKVVGA